MNSQEYNLNIRPGVGIPPIVRVSQNDAGRPLSFKMYDGASALTIASGTTIEIHGTKRSGLGFTEACTWSGSTVSVDTTEAMTQESGAIPTELVLTSGTDVIASANFTLVIEPSPHSAAVTDGTVAEAINAVTRCETYAQAAEDAAADAASDAAEAAETAVNALIATIPADYTSLTTQVATNTQDIGDLKADLGAVQTNNAPIVFSTFSGNRMVQRYHVGYVLYFKDDSSGVRAVNETPIKFYRRMYLIAPTGYEFSAITVTSKTDFTVLVNPETYVESTWIEANAWMILQVRRTDQTALTTDDLAVINAWIDFNVKEFEADDIKRLCASKKAYYTGSGTYFGNHHNLFTVAHLTDIHADVTRYSNFRQFVDDNTELIDCAICTGDYVDNQTDTQWSAMNGVTGTKGVLQVVGNHDAGHQAGDTLLTDAELVEKFGISTNTGKMYYYVDYDKVRIIVLNQFEGETKGTYVYSADEITWLLGVLDDSITNSMHVIIACHLPETFPTSNSKGFYQRYNKWYPSSPTMASGLEAIIDAFRNGTSIDTTLTNDIAVSHTFSASGDFVCWICGHYHGDYIGYSANYPSQLCIDANCGICQCLPFKTNFMGETNSDLARIPDTTSEDCFNCYSFDFNSRTVKVVKIGANVNDQLVERKSATFSMDGEA